MRLAIASGASQGDAAIRPRTEMSPQAPLACNQSARASQMLNGRPKGRKCQTSMHRSLIGYGT